MTKKRVVRARQRSRTALPSFTIPLNPLVHQIGVDRMQVGAHGSWRFERPSINLTGIADAEYAEAIISQVNDWGWFRKPERPNNKVIVKTLANQGSLLKSTRIEWDGFGKCEGNIRISLTCNPTETMANRLASILFDRVDINPSTFLSNLAGMSPRSFFTRHGVTPSLGDRENWLPDYNLAVELLGFDPFGAFMPIFFKQLMGLVTQLVAPVEQGVLVVNDGTSQRFNMGRVSGVLQWGKTSVPQIETYVERFHRTATVAVTSAAQSMLSSLDETRVRRHLHRISFEREIDLLSIRAELPSARDLSIYAKSHDRIRLEVSRPKRGRYHPQILQAPIDRLMQIFRSEREDFLTCCDWDAVASFFAEPELPWMGDLIDMIAAISDVCADNSVSIRPVILAMLGDGGGAIKRDSKVPSAVFDQLQARGIIERITLRNRDKSGARRITLQPLYQETFRVLLEAFETERATDA